MRSNFQFWVSSGLLLLLGLGNVNCTNPEAEQFTATETPDMFQELFFDSDEHVDDADQPIYFGSDHIDDDDLFSGVLRGDSKNKDLNKDLSSQIEELTDQVHEQIQHAVQQQDKIRQLFNLVEDVYMHEIRPSSEQTAYIDYYLGDMSDALNGQFLRKDSQLNIIYSHLLRLQNKFEENKKEIQNLSDMFGNNSKDVGSHSYNSPQVDAISESLGHIQQKLQSNSEQLHEVSDRLSRLDSEVQLNREHIEKTAGHLNHIDQGNQPQNGLVYSLSKDLAKLSEQLQITSDKLNRHLEETEKVDITQQTHMPEMARDCSDLPVGLLSGVHLVKPRSDDSLPVQAFCDLDTAGGRWIVIQRREDIMPREDFYRGWENYKEGFGNLEGEFWWGLENIWAVTSAKDRRYELRVDMEDFDGKHKYALYKNFHVYPESDGYRLSVSGYSGDAGDSLQDHSGQKFTTRDKDQDALPFENCAQRHRGGWWYRSCMSSNLNGKYYNIYRKNSTRGIIWKTFHGTRSAAIKTVTMKIRPAN